MRRRLCDVILVDAGIIVAHHVLVLAARVAQAVVALRDEQTGSEVTEALSENLPASGAQ